MLLARYCWRYSGNSLNKAKRQIAKSVGADPYSSNPVLREELERLARAAVAGGLTGSLGVGSRPSFVIFDQDCGP